MIKIIVVAFLATVLLVLYLFFNFAEQSPPPPSGQGSPPQASDQGSKNESSGLLYEVIGVPNTGVVKFMKAYKMKAVKESRSVYQKNIIPQLNLLCKFNQVNDRTFCHPVLEEFEKNINKLTYKDKIIFEELDKDAKITFEECSSSSAVLIKTRIDDKDYYLTYTHDEKEHLFHILSWRIRGYIKNSAANPCSTPSSQQKFYLSKGVSDSNENGIYIKYKIGNRNYYVTNSVDNLFGIPKNTPTDENLYVMTLQ